MIIIVGLGNPGKKFEKTRHNIGFQVIDELHSPRLQPRREMNKIQRTSLALRKKRDVYFFSDFNYKKKFQALISEGKFNDKKIVLAKPQTFMNKSGESVKTLITNYQLPITNLWVIHDDLDLPLGKIRISIGRGSAGHKGVESIIKELGTKNFVRFRIGICPETKKPKKVENFVLGKFNKEEEKIIKEAIKKAVKTIETTLKESGELPKI